MSKVKVKLPVDLHDDYGDSLNLGSATQEVEKTKAVETLLRAGAIVPVSYPQKKKTTGGKKTPIILNINGIGKKTIADLNTYHDSEEDLIEALKKDKVGIRDDMVILLKKHYKLI